MRLPVEWINEYVNTGADAKAIAVSLTMAGLEVEEEAQSAIGPVLDIKVTPNRGDCLSIRGVARELAAAYNVPMSDVLVTQSASPLSGNFVSVEIKAPELCSTYAARYVQNVRVGESPEWMQQRLTAAGMRPINNIVDITNYVMLETGQPLHTFDFDKISGGTIKVRRAQAGEILHTLDGEDRTLTPEMLVISDSGGPIALAGVMGGLISEVTESTTTLLLESAHFHPLAVRKTARLLGMRTEASFRFERTVDPCGALAAADRACELIAELGCGTPVVGAIKTDGIPLKTSELTLRPERAAKLLGFPISEEQCVDVLGRLGFILSASSNGVLTFVVPSWRTDVVREIDLVEEVGRVLGYDHIPEVLPSGQSAQGLDSQRAILSDRIRAILCGVGLQEVVGHTFVGETTFEREDTSDSRVPVRSALSAELSGLRRDLLPGLMDVLDRNSRRGGSPLSFFEVGSVFHKGSSGYLETQSVAGVLCGPMAERHWDKAIPGHTGSFFALRGIVDVLLDRLRTQNVTFVEGFDARFHPGRCADILIAGHKAGVIGELHPRLAQAIHVRDRICAFTLDVEPLANAVSAAKRFVPLTQYPSVVRDVAPRLAEEVSAGKLLEDIHALNLVILESVKVTDVYTGPNLQANTKSVTLQFAFRANDHTLSEDEVNAALDTVRLALVDRCCASFAA